MKISKSKQELARIISENGGWRDGVHWMSQDRDGGVYSFSGGKPVRHKEMWCLKSSSEKIGWKFAHAGAIKNWHQTILSRDEYFHLYPAPDADGCVSLGSSVERDNAKWLADGKINTGTFGAMPPPTIEQLAADYRNRKDYADRKQQEADAAKADAEAKLAELVAAGKALWLVLGVAAPEPELVITDWRDLQVGDEIATTSGRKLTVTGIRQYDESWPIDANDEDGGEWCVSANDWSFIRRP